MPARDGSGLPPTAWPHSATQLLASRVGRFGRAYRRLWRRQRRGFQRESKTVGHFGSGRLERTEAISKAPNLKHKTLTRTGYHPTVQLVDPPRESQNQQPPPPSVHLVGLTREHSLRP
jgi:hypothetical protein